MKICSFFFLILFVFVYTPFANAIIYDLVPSRQHGKGSANISTDKQEVWNELVTINGYKTNFKIEVSGDPTEDLLAALIHMDPELKYTAQDGNILAISERDNYQKRYLIVKLSGDKSTLCFSMNLPKQIGQPQWPNGLPHLSGVKLVNSFIYHARNTQAVEFETHQLPEQAFEGMLLELEAQNCHIVSGSLSENNSSGTAILAPENNQTLLLLGISKSDKNETSNGILLQSRK